MSDHNNDQTKDSGSSPVRIVSGGALSATTPLGFLQLTLNNVTAGSFTPPVGSRYVVLSVEGAAVRWRDDGTPPTAAVGMPLQEAAPPFTYTGALAVIAFIAQTGTSTISGSFYK